MLLQPGALRKGITLIELIVVIAIIAVLATLTALYFPRFQEGEVVARGADMLQGWLLIAKQQARRDGVPTGIRFSFGPDNVCREMVLIQQPPDFSQGFYLGPVDTTTNNRVGRFTLLNEDTNANGMLDPGEDANGNGKLDPQFGDASIPVQVGDYLEIYGGGPLRRISGIDPTTTRLTVDPNSPAFPANLSPTIITGETGNARTNYRIIPQPRPFADEQPMQLPDQVGILGRVSASNGSQNIPRTNPYYQILFAPSGAVIGEGTGNSQIIFWVMHLNPNVDKKTLITVQARTGFIAAHPVASGGDPFLFTRDARSSGM